MLISYLICFRRNKALIKELSNPVPGSKDLYFPTQYSQSFFTQCMACLWKQHWSYWRNPQYTAIRFLFTTVVAIMFGTMFWNLGSKRLVQIEPNKHRSCKCCKFCFFGSMYNLWHCKSQVKAARYFQRDGFHVCCFLSWC